MKYEIAHIDFETRSDIELKKTGVERYAESPNTSASCIAWCFDDGPVRGALRDDFQFLCDELFEHVARGGMVVAHNAPFELAIWNMLARRHNWWPKLAPEQTHCTMAMCLAMALPAALEDASKVLRLPYQKDMEGHALMKIMCKPRKPRKGEPKDVLLWHDLPEQHVRQLEYCKADVAPEREVWDRLPKLSERERAYWIIDRRINDRGIGIDMEAVRVCEFATGVEKDRLGAELSAVTRGEVTAGTQTAALLKWLKAQGEGRIPDLKRSTLERAFEKLELSTDVRRALEIRLEASKASTSKLNAAKVGVCADGRLRGLLQYHGTTTGRPGGRRFQPTNMIRTPDEWDMSDVDEVFFWADDLNAHPMLAGRYGSVMDAVSWSMRSLICAAPGKKLMAVDYSNIEGRVSAWLANEQWKLQAFRDYDTIIPGEFDDKGKPKRKGPDLYMVAASRSLGIPVEKITKAQRQNIGKVQELALGYQGAHGAILSMLKNGGKKYRWHGESKGVISEVSEITTAVRAAVPEDVFEEALGKYWRGAREAAEEILAERALEAERLAELGEEPDPYKPDFFNVMAEVARVNRYGMLPDDWAALRVVVDSWRMENAQIVKAWYEVEAAAIDAVLNPGTVTESGRLKYSYSGDFLRCRLPSGRKIAYPYPRIKWEVRRFKRDDGSEFEKKTPKLMYEGKDTRTHKWGTQYAYGGMLWNNNVQGTARCIQSDSQHRLEAAGYPIILHVYDENVCETGHNWGSLDEMQRIMLDVEPWSRGIPIACDGWEGVRYRK